MFPSPGASTPAGPNSPTGAFIGFTLYRKVFAEPLVVSISPWQPFVFVQYRFKEQAAHCPSLLFLKKRTRAKPAYPKISAPMMALNMVNAPFQFNPSKRPRRKMTKERMYAMIKA